MASFLWQLFLEYHRAHMFLLSVRFKSRESRLSRPTQVIMNQAKAANQTDSNPTHEAKANPLNDAKSNITNHAKANSPKRSQINSPASQTITPLRNPYASMNWYFTIIGIIMMIVSCGLFITTLIAKEKDSLIGLRMAHSVMAFLLGGCSIAVIWQMKVDRFLNIHKWLTFVSIAYLFLLLVFVVVRSFSTDKQKWNYRSRLGWWPAVLDWT